jgi:hypothetical protein
MRRELLMMESGFAIVEGKSWGQPRRLSSRPLASRKRFDLPLSDPLCGPSNKADYGCWKGDYAESAAAWAYAERFFRSMC